MNNKSDCSSTRTKWEMVLCLLMLGMTLTLFLLQTRLLFIFPQPNSLRWFGDETWLMSEAKTQFTTGIVRYPLAVGSTLEHSKGLVLSMTWLSAVLYGLPATLFPASPVAIGRVVTAVLSFLLILTIGTSARSLGASRFSAAAIMLFLVSSSAFFFASHSCRPDILASLILLAFVAIGTKFCQNTVKKDIFWWLAFGGAVMFFTVSSSIHLLTLLLPVSIYFVWRDNASSPMGRWVGFISGVVTTLVILILVYFMTTGNVTLFAHSTAPTQFNDVLSSIPILRPFSRSVQVANILIRLKQFVAEAPQLLPLLPLLPLALIKIEWRKKHSVFFIALIIIFLSWLLLQGTEITYLIHIVPLLMLAMGLGISKILEQDTYRSAAMFLLTAAGIIFFVFGLQDVTKASTTAELLDHSNQSAITNITHKIASTWDQPGKPRVVTEPAALDRLSSTTNIQAITDHFISFPERREPFDSFFVREHIDYVILYNSPTYPKDRPEVDPFYRAVTSTGSLIDKEIGMTGDIGRDYFKDSSWKDTLLLFKLHIVK